MSSERKTPGDHTVICIEMSNHHSSGINGADEVYKLIKDVVCLVDGDKVSNWLESNSNGETSVCSKQTLPSPSGSAASEEEDVLNRFLTNDDVHSMWKVG